MSLRKSKAQDPDFDFLNSDDEDEDTNLKHAYFMPSKLKNKKKKTTTDLKKTDSMSTRKEDWKDGGRKNIDGGKKPPISTKFKSKILGKVTLLYLKVIFEVIRLDDC